MSREHLGGFRMGLLCGMLLALGFGVWARDQVRGLRQDLLICEAARDTATSAASLNRKLKEQAEARRPLLVQPPTLLHAEP